MAQEPHSPNENTRRTVEAMIAGGIPQEDVALVIGIDSKTLRKYYREELDTAAAKANAMVAKTLYQKAIGGDTTSLIWWTKGRMGWSEKRENTIQGGENPIQYAQVSGEPLTADEWLTKHGHGDHNTAPSTR